MGFFLKHYLQPWQVPKYREMKINSRARNMHSGMLLAGGGIRNNGHEEYSIVDL